MFDLRQLRIANLTQSVVLDVLLVYHKVCVRPESPRSTAIEAAGLLADLSAGEEEGDAWRVGSEEVDATVSVFDVVVGGQGKLKDLVLQFGGEVEEWTWAGSGSVAVWRLGACKSVLSLASVDRLDCVLTTGLPSLPAIGSIAACLLCSLCLLSFTVILCERCGQGYVEAKIWNEADTSNMTSTLASKQHDAWNGTTHSHVCGGCFMPW